MAELADALGSGPSDRKVVEVRVLLSAPRARFRVSGLRSQLSALSSQLSALSSQERHKLDRLFCQPDLYELSRKNEYVWDRENLLRPDT